MYSSRKTRNPVRLCAERIAVVRRALSRTRHTKERRVIDPACVGNVSREDPLRETRGELPSQPSRPEHGRVLMAQDTAKIRKILSSTSKVRPSAKRKCAEMSNFQIL